MLSRIANAMVVGLFVLLSGCYLSFEVSHSTEVDAGTPSVTGRGPSVVGGDPSVVGGNHSADIEKPIVDAGIEEALLPGAWQGRLMYANGRNEVSFLDNWAFEFTDTEVFISFSEVKIYGAEYSINRKANPYQLDMKLEDIYFDTALTLTEEEIELIDLAHPTLAIFRIENSELTIAMSGWPFAPAPFGSGQSIPRSFDPGQDGATFVFELTSVR